VVTSGPEVLFKTCVAMKFVDDNDDDDDDDNDYRFAGAPFAGDWFAGRPFAYC